MAAEEVEWVDDETSSQEEDQPFNDEESLRILIKRAMTNYPEYDSEQITNLIASDNGFTVDEGIQQVIEEEIEKIKRSGVPVSVVVDGDMLINSEAKDGFNYRVPKECMTRYMTAYSIIRYIKCGQYGCVFQICLEGDNECGYVIKISHDDEEIDLKNELITTQLMSDNNISPKVIKSWQCEGEYNSRYKWENTDLFFIVMQKMDMTLQEYIQLYPTKFKEDQARYLDKLKELVNGMARLNIAHRDLRADNVMVNVNGSGNIIDMKIIDFGKAEKLHVYGREEIESDWYTLHRDISQLISA